MTKKKQEDQKEQETEKLSEWQKRNKEYLEKKAQEEAEKEKELAEQKKQHLPNSEKEKVEKNDENAEEVSQRRQKSLPRQKLLRKNKMNLLIKQPCEKRRKQNANKLSGKQKRQEKKSLLAISTVLCQY